MARDLGCSRQTVLRLTSDFASGGRRTAWAFQGYAFVIFLRYRRHRRAKCGHPQFYLISRYALHRIGGRPGKVRARLRQKTAQQWYAYLALIKKLAHGQIIRRRERADDKHKGSPLGGTGGSPAGRSPPTANRPGLRRFIGVAEQIQREFDNQPGTPRIYLHGWLLNRLDAWHSRERIVAMLKHACGVLHRMNKKPVNIPAWVCEVARRHLEADGFGKIQRRHEIEQRDRKRKITVIKSATGTLPDFIDSDAVIWKHLGGHAGGTNWIRL